MAEFLVQGASLTAVADAIRERGGTTAPLSFPAGMAKAVRGIPSGGTEQFVVTLTDKVSDKTPAEIAEAVKAKKQVVLQRTFGGKIETGYLVSITNKVAAFCFVGSYTGDIDVILYDQMLVQEWVTITADKTAEVHSELHVPALYIEKDANGNYTSTLTPLGLLEAGVVGPAANAYLNTINETFSGNIVQNDNSEFHVYFPDYAKGKIYDLKWNNDENPSTYTFTELSFGNSGGSEGPMTVTFTVTDMSTFALEADTPYADIMQASNVGRIVYAFVPAPVGPLLAQLTGTRGGVALFNSLNGIGEVMTITMESDSVIHGTVSDLLCRPGDIVGGGDFDAGNHRIMGVKEPTDMFDATDKYYVDHILTAGNSDSVVIKSSTPNSSKKFRITVDDAGAITATEV